MTSRSTSETAFTTPQKPDAILRLLGGESLTSVSEEVRVSEQRLVLAILIGIMASHQDQKIQW